MHMMNGVDLGTIHYGRYLPEMPFAILHSQVPQFHIFSFRRPEDDHVVYKAGGTDGWLKCAPPGDIHSRYSHWYSLRPNERLSN